MDRIFELNAGVVAMTAPAPTAQLGYIKEGAAPTSPGAWWFHMATMELVNAIAAGGVTPDATKVNQLATVITGILTKQTTLENSQAASLAAGMPYGALLPWPGETPPDGFIIAQGQQIARLGAGSYPKLTAALLGGKLKVVTDAQWVGGMTGAYSTGDGSTTFRLPDGRAAFLRGGDIGLGVDPGRVVGSLQGDAIRNIWGQFRAVRLSGGDPQGVFYDSPNIYAGNASPGGGAHSYTGFDASRVVPTANENRPRNIAIVWCVRAYDPA